MRGMRSFFDGRHAQGNYAEGGVVRGPGTGTSDEVPDEVREGTFIMPADSTKAVGAQRLTRLGARVFDPDWQRPPAPKPPAGARGFHPDRVRVNLSDGEFKMPPEQVHAVGAQVLNQMKDATHTPARAAGARGSGPELFFADGGLVGDDDQKRLGGAAAAPGATLPTSPSNTFPGNRLQGDSGFSGAPSGRGMSWANPPAAQAAAAPAPAAPPPGARGMGWATRPSAPERPASAVPSGARGMAWAATPASPAPSPSVSPSGLYMQDRAQEMKDQWGRGDYAEAAGTAARTAVEGAGMYGLEAADKLASPWVNAAKGFGAGFLGRSASAAAPPPPAPAAVAALPGATPTPQSASLASVEGTMGRGAGDAPPAEATDPAAVSGNVTRSVGADGRATYSGANIGGDITINGQAPRNGGLVSPQNNAAAENLASGARGMGWATRPSLSQASTPAPRLGFGPGSELERIRERAAQPGFSGVIGQQSGNGNMWSRTPEQQRRDAEVQASSIHRRTAARGAGILRALDAQDIERVRGANALEQEGLRGANALAQENVRQTGGLQREDMQQQGANTRTAMNAAVDKQRVAQEGRRVDSQVEAQGYANRAASQQEKLRAILADPAAPVARKMEAQRTLSALAGQGDRWKPVALQGGTDAQGNKTESILGAVNERTGEMRRMDAGQVEGMPPGMVKQVGTAGGKPVYEDANGKRFVAG